MSKLHRERLFRKRRRLETPELGNDLCVRIASVGKYSPRRKTDTTLYAWISPPPEQGITVIARRISQYALR